MRARVRYSRMLLAGIQAKSDLNPDLLQKADGSRSAGLLRFRTL
jgi:hypothetical protein